MARLLPRGALALALLLTGCGSGGSGDAGGTEQTLRLAGPPAAVDAPLYLAMARGYDEAEGVVLRLRSGPGTSEQLLRTGRIDAAVLPIDRAAAPGLVAVMALVQDDRAGPPRRPGEPPRPGLVLTVTRDTLTDHRAAVRAIVHALQRGMVEAAADPPSAVAAMIDADDTLDRGALTAELERIADAFTAGARAPGALDPARLRAWSRATGETLAFDAGLAGPVSRD